MNLQLAAAALAASLGVSVPVPVPETVVPPVKARPLTMISAFGYVHGSGWVFCAEGPTHSGTLNGAVQLSGEAPATGPDGEMGTVQVFGTVFLSGSCGNGSGWAQGLASLSGGGALSSPTGRHGRADLSGTVMVSANVNGSYVFINEPVTLTGTFSED